MDGTVRLNVISGQTLVETARTTHNLSCTCTAALGRQLMMTAMMASELKNETDSVTTIISGNGPAGNLVCVGRYGAFVKGCIGDPGVELPPTPWGKLDVSGAVGKQGKLTVVRDLSLKEPYTGMCNLISGEIAEDFAQYFTASQQQPSLVYLGVHVRPEPRAVLSAGGLLMQPLPNCPDESITLLQEKADAICTLTQRLEQGELLNDILNDIFAGMDLQIAQQVTPRLLCDCSRARLERALISLGKEELEDILKTDGSADLACHFCNEHYFFDANDLEQLLREATQNS